MTHVKKLERRFVGWLSLCLVPILLWIVYYGCACSTTLVRHLFFIGEDSWAHYQAGGMFVTSSPSASRNSSPVVFASVCTGRGDIYAIGVDAKTPLRLTSSTDFESSPVISDDGHQIAYSKETSTRRHVWLMNSDGSNQRQLSYGDVLDDPVAFSSDGQHMLIHRSEVPLGGQGKTTNAFVMVTEGPGENHLPVGTDAVFMPGKSVVVYTEDQLKIWSIDLHKVPTTPRSHPGRGFPIGFSADGKFLITGRRDPASTWAVEHEIWVNNLKENKEWQIASGFSASCCGSGSDCHILYFKGYEQTMFTVGLNGMKSHQVSLPTGIKTHPRVTPQRERLLLGVFQKTGSPNYDIISVSGDGMQVSVVGSVGCP